MVWLIVARAIQGIGAGAVSVLWMQRIMVAVYTDNESTY